LLFLCPDQESGGVFRLALVRPYAHPDLAKCLRLDPYPEYCRAMIFR